MDHNSIIDRNTFDICKHAEDHKDVFICDKEIAEAISLLNKKGYVTYASCSGHYKIEFYEWFDEDINKLDEYKNNPRIIIKNIKENSFDYWSEVDKTGIYVLFKKQYNFKNLPENFIETISNDRTCISSLIEYYDEFGKRKRKDIVEKEIQEKCNILKKWVEQLPKER